MKRKEFINLLNERILFIDGAYGTEFLKKGYKDKLIELLNITNPDIVESLQQQYVNAKVDILLTNTFSANLIKLKNYNLETEIERINLNAYKIARNAAGDKAFVFGDIGPTGSLMEPLGELPFDECYNCFYTQAKILIEAKVDGIILETFSEIKELKTAILAIRDISLDIPLIAQMTFTKEGISTTGSSLEIFTTLMNDLDVDVIGINCTLSSEEIFPLFLRLKKLSKKPISIEPNGGNPEIIGGKLTYKTTPVEFALYAKDFAENGANIIGGCCGIGPTHIKKMIDFVGMRKPTKIDYENRQYVSSRTIIKPLDPFLIIGEKINASANKKLQRLFINNEFDSLISLASKQKDEKADCLDINFGKEDKINEQVVKNTMLIFDKYNSLPLSLDIIDINLLEVALKHYPARPIINSSLAKKDDLEKHITLMKRYGGLLVVLIMEKEVNEDYQKKKKIVNKVLKICEENKIGEERIIFDPILLPLNSCFDYKNTLKVIEYLSNKKLYSIIGLSNLSYKIDEKEKINAAFLSLALDKGLSSVIVDTSSKITMDIIQGNLLLNNRSSFRDGIDFENPLLEILIKGDKDAALAFVDEKLKELNPIEFIENHLSKAMEKVGYLFSNGKIFLPHLIISSEIAQFILEYLKNKIDDKLDISKGKIILATVKDDIHDIGKNIIAAILKSNGFEVYDIGKNVSKEEILQKVYEIKPDIIGLSAMMTSTVSYIKDTFEFLKSNNIKIPIIAGGASMNKNLADQYGVLYAKDGIEAIKLCNEIIKKGNSYESYK